MAKRKITVKNTTPVVINDEEMFLKYNMYAIEQMKKEGVDLTKFGESTVDISDIITVLYCGLLTYDKTLTRDEVAMMVDIDDVEYLADKISEALNTSKSIKPKN